MNDIWKNSELFDEPKFTREHLVPYLHQQRRGWKFVLT